MALKPIPRLILIVTVVGAAIGGVVKFMDKSPMAAQQVQTPQNSDYAHQQPVQQPQTQQPVQAQAAVGGGSAYQTIVEKGVVRASVQSPSKPFFFSEQGVAKGFDVDFMKLLFSQSEFTKQHGKIVIDTDHKVDTYPEIPEALLKKDSRGNAFVDIALGGLTFVDTDLNGVVYSVPYVDDFGYSLITSGRSTIRTLADLKGMTVGVLEGDPDVEAYVKSHMPDSKIVKLSDAAINGQRTWINNAIKSGKVDALVYDFPFATAEISDTDLQFAMTKLPDSDIKYKIGVRKEDSQLLENINIAIRKAKEDPQYVELLKKYFMSSNVAAVKAAEGNETVYIVKRGDTLGNIAAVLLGDQKRYAAIQARNNLANPNLIQVGQRLVIPK